MPDTYVITDIWYTLDELPSYYIYDLPKIMDQIIRAWRENQVGNTFDYVPDGTRHLGKQISKAELFMTALRILKLPYEVIGEGDGTHEVSFSTKGDSHKGPNIRITFNRPPPPENRNDIQLKEITEN